MRKVIAAALVAGAVAAPATVMAAKPSHPVKPVKKAPVVTMVFHGIVVADAVDGSVTVRGRPSASWRTNRGMTDPREYITLP